MKKVLCIALALVLCIGLSVSAFALQPRSNPNECPYCGNGTLASGSIAWDYLANWTLTGSENCGHGHRNTAVDKYYIQYGTRSTLCDNCGCGTITEYAREVVRCTYDSAYYYGNTEVINIIYVS